MNQIYDQGGAYNNYQYGNQTNQQSQSYGSYDYGMQQQTQQQPPFNAFSQPPVMRSGNHDTILQYDPQLYIILFELCLRR